jgi:hypothetical protein
MYSLHSCNTWLLRQMLHYILSYLQIQEESQHFGFPSREKISYSEPWRNDIRYLKAMSNIDDKRSRKVMKEWAATKFSPVPALQQCMTNVSNKMFSIETCTVDDILPLEQWELFLTSNKPTKFNQIWPTDLRALWRTETDSSLHPPLTLSCRFAKTLPKKTWEIFGEVDDGDCYSTNCRIAQGYIAVSLTNSHPCMQDLLTGWRRRFSLGCRSATASGKYGE